MGPKEELIAALLSHAVAGAGIATVLRPQFRPPARYWVLAIVCAVAPDLDILGVWMGANYLGMFGHRGFMHSIFFAGILAVLLSCGAFSSSKWRELRFRAGLAFFVAGAFHGILDALMSAGKGVAFFAPFSRARFHFPIRPIRVSPPSSEFLFREGGIRVSGSELLWIWIPSMLLIAVSYWYWKARARRPGSFAPARSGRASSPNTP
ncbi:MAG: metal-dependent hydrolase [Thermoanaerobaculia bacterium]